MADRHDWFQEQVGHAAKQVRSLPDWIKGNRPVGDPPPSKTDRSAESGPKEELLKREPGNGR